MHVAQCGNFIILCEINFRDIRGPKTVITTHLDALNFDFYEFLHFRKIGIYPNQKLKVPNITKMAFFGFLHSEKLISRKIFKFVKCVQSFSVSLFAI